VGSVFQESGLRRLRNRKNLSNGQEFEIHWDETGTSRGLWESPGEEGVERGKVGYVHIIKKSDRYSSTRLRLPSASGIYNNQAYLRRRNAGRMSKEPQGSDRGLETSVIYAERKLAKRSKKNGEG